MLFLLATTSSMIANQTSPPSKARCCGFVQVSSPSSEKKTSRSSHAKSSEHERSNFFFEKSENSFQSFDSGYFWTEKIGILGFLLVKTLSPLKVLPCFCYLMRQNWRSILKKKKG